MDPCTTLGNGLECIQAPENEKGYVSLWRQAPSAIQQHWEDSKCYHVSPNPFYVARNVPKLKLGIPCVPTTLIRKWGHTIWHERKKGEMSGQPCLPERPRLFFGLNFSLRNMPKVLAWIANLLSERMLHRFGTEIREVTGRRGYVVQVYEIVIIIGAVILFIQLILRIFRHRRFIWTQLRRLAGRQEVVLWRLS